MLIKDNAHVRGYLQGRLSLREASEKMGVARSTLWRLKGRFDAKGDAAFVHGLTGRPSNNAKPRRKGTGAGIPAPIRSCIESVVERPALFRATVLQTEGYLSGLQGHPWRTSREEDAAFLGRVRAKDFPLRGRIKKNSAPTADSFTAGFLESFPDAAEKPFLRSLSRLWARRCDGGTWEESSFLEGRNAGERLREEYGEGTAGGLSVLLLDERLHLRPVRLYLRMKGWLIGRAESLSRSRDPWEREAGKILSSNVSSVVLRALHNGDPDYASRCVERVPVILRFWSKSIARLAAREPEAAGVLRDNRLTVITYTLHSGYFDYPERILGGFSESLSRFDRKLADLRASDPETARILEANRLSVVYRALANGRVEYLTETAERFPQILRRLEKPRRPTEISLALHSGVIGRLQKGSVRIAAGAAA
jgi:hypothetical protein